MLALTGESYASSLGLNDNHEGLHIGEAAAVCGLVARGPLVLE